MQPKRLAIPDIERYRKKTPEQRARVDKDIAKAFADFREYRKIRAEEVEKRRRSEGERVSSEDLRNRGY